MRSLVASLFLVLSASCTPFTHNPYQGTFKVEGYRLATMQVLGNGTGFAVGEHYLITASHVCIHASDSIGFFNDLVPLKVVRMDTTVDLCLMYSEVPFVHWLKVAKVEPKQGDYVAIYGYPEGVPHDMKTEGTFSGGIEEGYTQMYQLSCPAYGGNSGGPVVNSDGEVIGVLLQGSRDYPQISISSSLPNLQKFLAGK